MDQKFPPLLTCYEYRYWSTRHSIDDMIIFSQTTLSKHHIFPDSNVHGPNMGPIWGRQDPGGPHVGPMNFAI